MNWYLKVIKENFANFEGRARRTEYWMFCLFNCLIVFGLAILAGVFAAMDIQALSLLFMGCYMVYALLALIPSLAVTVRRLHDTGKSGWMLLIGLIPFIGSIWLLVLYATEGDQGDNQYGPDPKSLPDPA
ncbi:DUF805 domain-containing protein [Aquimarina intermedia]|uniref:Uncharacterized membrane protein YhaH (DUF805 family) n=1 Tax=Aquimarina intermedia TaxID=350814 RepID=A0A5S5CBY7_9FLAO|nr:DUF805 domain-containing protein [Aquimarina intermedia]TYP76158.1 uncharacterized membrane protein YhaH (DUF805 family) [Aquimarina intermedia]